MLRPAAPSIEHPTTAMVAIAMVAATTSPYRGRRRGVVRRQDERRGEGFKLHEEMRRVGAMHGHILHAWTDRVGGFPIRPQPQRIDAGGEHILVIKQGL